MRFVIRESEGDTYILYSEKDKIRGGVAVNYVCEGTYHYCEKIKKNLEASQLRVYDVLVYCGRDLMFEECSVDEDGMNKIVEKFKADGYRVVVKDQTNK